MEYRIGVTDPTWYKNLRQLTPTPRFVNFWSTSSRDPDMYDGEPFLFRLRHSSPIRELDIDGSWQNEAGNSLYFVGGGYFRKWERITIGQAWAKYKTANGAASLEDLISLIQTASKNKNIGRVDENTVILCQILRDPFFLPRPFTSRYYITKGNSGPNANTNDESGMIVYQKVIQQLLPVSELSTAGIQDMTIIAEIEQTEQRYVAIETKRRIGQEEFRKTILDSYKKQCAITGDSVLSLLQAAHIIPYAQGGSHDVNNGILLRADFHILFDEGYITISDDYRVLVSEELKEIYQHDEKNQYLKCEGQKLKNKPHHTDKRPSKSSLEWHRKNVFRR